MSKACAHKQEPAEATHSLRDGDEADADEREEAAAVPAGSGEGRWSDPSHESSAEHARSCPHAPAPSRTSTCAQHVPKLTFKRAVSVHTLAHIPCTDQDRRKNKKLGEHRLKSNKADMQGKKKQAKAPLNL